MSVNHRFYHMPDDRLDDKKQGERPKQHGPGWIDGDSKNQRKGCSDSRADIRYEAQHRCQNAPQDRAGDANQPQALPMMTPKLPFRRS